MPMETEKLIERLGGKLLENMEQLLEGEGKIELKDYKTVTAALRELKELCRSGEEKEDKSLVVRFVGEAEDMAR